jgi:ribosomal protein S18 acetylase RimI-like enzyme
MVTTSREMTRKDLPQVVSISRENMAPIIFASWGVEYRDEDLLHLLLTPAAYTEVVEEEGRIVAYFSVEERNESLFINSIQVLKGHQGRGLGGEMMRRIEERARGLHLRDIELWVQISNSPAIDFYRHMGYRLISRQGNNYLMRKMLDPALGWKLV